MRSARVVQAIHRRTICRAARGQEIPCTHEIAPLISASCAAGVAQLVEHFLAKEDVASSSLVTRSSPHSYAGLCGRTFFVEV